MKIELNVTVLFCTARQFWLCLLCMGHAVPKWDVLSGDGLGAVYGLKGFFPLQLDLIYDHYVQVHTVGIISTRAAGGEGKL